jgi:hypothetical protein
MQLPDQHDDQPDGNLEAPPKLVSALKRLPQESIFIPSTTDEAVLRAARQHLSRRQAPRFQWFRRMPWVAAAATAVLLLIAVPQLSRNVSSEAASIHENRNVDILDAFALARQLKNGPVTDHRMDLNHDGVVDDRDVADLAAQAVKLDKKGRS